MVDWGLALPLRRRTLVWLGTNRRISGLNEWMDGRSYVMCLYSCYWRPQDNDLIPFDNLCRHLLIFTVLVLINFKHPTDLGAASSCTATSEKCSGVISCCTRSGSQKLLADTTVCIYIYSTGALQPSVTVSTVCGFKSKYQQGYVSLHCNLASPLLNMVIFTSISVRDLLAIPPKSPGGCGSLCCTQTVQLARVIMMER